jgi:A/G-specific adenine glycosylase
VLTRSPTPSRSTKLAAPSPAALLDWYDRHRRALPWRVKAGERPEPYRVWLSEIMLQQTTVKAVAPYYQRFLGRFPNVQALAAAPVDAVMQAWAGLGYYSRARHLHACAKDVVARLGGQFPDTEEALRALPGIGPYTAAAIAAIAFDRKAAAVDGNVERVVARFFAIDEPLPQSKPAIRARAAALVPDARAGDFAQALMDLGATICTPKRPACALCPWTNECRARAAGLQGVLPYRTAKADGALRRGAAFVAMRRDGAILLRTRPAKGLLGGMVEVPGSEWTPAFDADEDCAEAPFAAAWRRLPGVVRHTFTHFPLELAVFAVTVPQGKRAPRGCRWAPAATLAGEALPSLMRKVLAHALPDGRTPA